MTYHAWILAPLALYGAWDIATDMVAWLQRKLNDDMRKG